MTKTAPVVERLRLSKPFFNLGLILCLGLSFAAIYVGVAAMTAGDLDAADAAFARAVEQARRLDAVPHVARALADRAEVLTRRARAGDAATAEQLLEEATSLAASVGLVLRPLGATR